MGLSSPPPSSPPTPSFWDNVKHAYDPAKNLRALFRRTKPKTAATASTAMNLDFIDGLRALSHLWIVVHHVHYLMGILVDGQQLGLTSSSWVMRLFGMQAPFAVNIMLFMSGYFGFRSVLSLPEAKGGRLEALSLRTTVHFFCNRYLRLAPLYYFMAFIYWANMDLRIFMDPMGLLYSALFLSNYVRVEMALYLISWSICVDMHLYLALPALYEAYRRLVRRYRAPPSPAAEVASPNERHMEGRVGEGQKVPEEEKEEQGGMEKPTVVEAAEQGDQTPPQSPHPKKEALGSKHHYQTKKNKKKSEKKTHAATAKIETKSGGGGENKGSIPLSPRGWKVLMLVFAIAIVVAIALRVHFIYPFYANEMNKLATRHSQRAGDGSMANTPVSDASEMDYRMSANFTMPYRAYLYNMVKEDEVILLVNEMSFFSSEYRYTHLRYTPFICGVLLAIVFAHRKAGSMTFRPCGSLVLLSVMGMALILVPNASGGEPGSWTATGTFIYLIFHHITFSLCFTYFMYANFFYLHLGLSAKGDAISAKKQSIMNSIWSRVLSLFRFVLEWQGWCVIARLSYANYLTHFAAIIIEYRTLPRMTEMNDMKYITLALINIPLTLAISLALHLLIEKPISNLVSIYLGRPGGRCATSPTTPITPIVTPKSSPGQHKALSTNNVRSEPSTAIQ